MRGIATQADVLLTERNKKTISLLDLWFYGLLRDHENQNMGANGTRINLLNSCFIIKYLQFFRTVDSVVDKICIRDSRALVLSVMRLTLYGYQGQGRSISFFNMQSPCLHRWPFRLFGHHVIV